MIKTIYILMLAVLVAMGLASCDHDAMPESVIVANDRFTLSGDSLVMGDTIIYSLDGYTINSNIPGSKGELLQVKLSHDDKLSDGFYSEHKLVDALSALSAQVIARNQADPKFDSPNDMIDAIGLALAYLNPSLSMKLLRQQVKDGRVMGEDNDFYPAHNDRLAWASAAWRVYLANGDREWLRWAYEVASATLRRDQDVAIDATTGLVHGSTTGYTPLTSELPAWMDNNEVYATYTLNNNVEMIIALLDMADMADELGIDGSSHERLAARCIEALNERMWNENRGRYAAMVYGQPYGLQSPSSDNRAQAMAVMNGMADDDDRASTLVEKTAVNHCGINAFYPSRQYNPDPCLDTQGWGLLQGLWNLASAHVDNDNSLRRGLAALWRAQALYSTSMASGTSSQLDLAMAVSNVAMTHRLIAGINFEPQGIDLAPVVPSCLPGDKRLMGFRYRGATLDITIKGTGHDVDFVLLDDKRIDGTFIDASSLKGRHSIVVTMAEGHMGNQGATIASGRTLRPDEPIVMWNGDSATIFNYNPNLDYRLMVDGSRPYAITDSTFALPGIDNFAQVSVVASNRHTRSYSSRPFVLGGKNYYYTPIAEADAGSESITLDIDVRKAGTYALNVNYISAASTIDVRTVSANTHRMGIIVMAGLGTDSLASQSNIIPVELLTGKNSITITAHPSSHPTATPLSLYLFKK